MRACLQVRECHGSTELFQYAVPRATSPLRSPSHQLGMHRCATPCCGRIWRAPMHLRFDVATDAMLAAPGFSSAAPPPRDTGMRAAPPTKHAPTADGRATVGAVRGVRRERPLRCLPRGPEEEERMEQARAGFREDAFPLCIECGGVARPAVLMFNDDQWVDHTAQASRPLLTLHATRPCVHMRAAARHARVASRCICRHAQDARFVQWMHAVAREAHRRHRARSGGSVQSGWAAAAGLLDDHDPSDAV